MGSSFFYLHYTKVTSKPQAFKRTVCLHPTKNFYVPKLEHGRLPLKWYLLIKRCFAESSSYDIRYTCPSIEQMDSKKARIECVRSARTKLSLLARMMFTFLL